MFTNEFTRYLSAQKVQDEKTIKIVEQRSKCRYYNDIGFWKRVRDAQVTMNMYACELSQILEEYVDRPLVEFVFGRSFDLNMVQRTLKDERFIGFLFVSGLMNRTMDLDYQSKGEIKLRLYFAILNFDEHKKQKLYYATNEDIRLNDCYSQYN